MLVPAGTRFCDEHRRAYHKSINQRRDPELAKGYGATWRKFRLLILHRDPICVICHAELSTEVDHIIPKAAGGEDTETNTQGVCSPCHARKTVLHDGGFGNQKRNHE